MAANATAIWRVRPSGSNTNGGGYDSGIASAGTDRSQQDAAYLSNIGTVSTATVTLTDTGAAFTTDLIGNGIYVSGTGITTTYTFITGAPSSTTLTLQTSPGTTGTSVTYNIGGGWADPWTNTLAASGWVVAGNTIYILGAGTPNPSSYSYDYTRTGNFVPTAGSAANGMVTFANDPATPGYKAPPDTTGGMPCISVNGLFIYSNATNSGYKIQGIYFVANGQTNNVYGLFDFSINGALGNELEGIVFDTKTYDIGLMGGASSAAITTHFIGCEVFSSTGSSGGSNYVIDCYQIQRGSQIIGCNFHDTMGPAVRLAYDSSIYDSIIAKCHGTAVTIHGIAGQGVVVKNCTIDANTGHGIEVDSQVTLSGAVVCNNIISNHVTAAKYGMTVDAGTAAANDRIKNFIDYNTFYNNTNNYNAISAGAHDTSTGSNPYTAQSTENYQLV